MTTDSSLLDTPVSGLVVSWSDRPWYRRALHSSGQFFLRKPLGGFGVVVIGLVVFAALFADVISRYDPGESFSVVKPKCTADESKQIEVAVTAQVTTHPPLSVCFDE